MRTTRSTATPTTVKADLLVVPIGEPKKTLSSPAAAVDKALKGIVKAAVADGEITVKPGSVTVLHTGGKIPAARVAAVGVGDGSVDSWRSAGAAIGRRARDLGARSVALALPDGLDEASATAFIESLGVGNYRFDRYKTSPRKERKAAIDRLAVVNSPLSKDALTAAARTSEAVNASRDLSNTPANDLTPTALAEYAQGLAQARENLDCEILDEEQLLGLGAGALLAVSRGSDQPAKMIVLRYQPADAVPGEVLGLVGKAVTFDTGGISIKPAGGMEDMKMDMSGGAAVLEATALIADLGLPIEVLAVVPTTENMPNGSAARPGDVVTAMNGKTIEIINTDAEGRLILADALTWCARNGATRMIDFATLTGAIVLALGDVHAGLFGSDRAFTDQVKAAGDASGDLVWELPLHPRYDPLIRSKVADLSNASNKRQASSIYAAQFLREFTEGLPWCHLDIAGTGMVGGAGTGSGVRLMLAVARALAAPTESSA
jgi:leucyl aminopeptidase